jgi:hypothetical protein
MYYCRILDKYKKPITAFAIYADNNKSFHPKQYRREFLGTKVYYEFNTCKILDLDDAELEASNNPFAMAMLSAKLSLRPGTKDQQLFDLAYDLAKRLLIKQMPKEKIRKVMSFLRYYLRFDNPEMISKFEQKIAILTERDTTMGIDEFLLSQARKEGMETGFEKGIEKGMTEKELEKNTAFSISLLSSTDFSTLKIAGLVGVTEEFVLNIKKKFNL